MGDGNRLDVQVYAIDGLLLAIQSEYLLHPCEIVGKVADIHTDSLFYRLGRSPEVGICQPHGPARLVRGCYSGAPPVDSC